MYPNNIKRMKNFNLSRSRELSLFSFENTEREISEHIYREQIKKADEFLKKNHHADLSHIQCLLRSMMPKEYHSLIEELKEAPVSTTTYSITGGQNVIAPNATTANQNVYNDQYMK